MTGRREADGTSPSTKQRKAALHPDRPAAKPSRGARAPPLKHPCPPGRRDDLFLSLASPARLSESIAAKGETALSRSTPLLIVATPRQQEPLIWWASREYVVAAVARLDEDSSLAFDKAWARYRRIHDEAWCFASRDEARQWADAYFGPHFLAIRATLAQIGAPPADVIGVAL